MIYFITISNSVQWVLVEKNMYLYLSMLIRIYIFLAKYLGTYSLGNFIHNYILELSFQPNYLGIHTEITHRPG